MLSGEAKNTNFIPFGLTPRSTCTSLEMNTLTITTRFIVYLKLRCTCTMVQLVNPDPMFNYVHCIHVYIFTSENIIQQYKN